jgi:hypothetical protein
MQNNQLFIEIDGVYLEADLGQEEVAVNIQSFDVGDIENRYIDYSQAIKLPTTAVNNKLFNHANEFTTYTDILQDQLPCIFLVSGVNVFGLGSYITVTGITDEYYDCQIVGGASEFLNLLRGKINDKVKTLNDLTWGDDDKIKRSIDEWTGYTATKLLDAFWAIADFDKTNEKTDTFNPATFTCYTDLQKPFIWFKTILDKILEDNGGYTLVSDLGDFIDMAIPFASINKKINTGVLVENVELKDDVAMAMFGETIGYVSLTPTINAPASGVATGRFDTTVVPSAVYTVGTITDVGNGLKYTVGTTGTHIFKVNQKSIAKFSNVNYDYIIRFEDNIFRASKYFRVYVNGSIVYERTFQSSCVITYHGKRKGKHYYDIQTWMNNGDFEAIIDLKLNYLDEVVFTTSIAIEEYTGWTGSQPEWGGAISMKQTFYVLVTDYTIEMLDIYTSTSETPVGDYIPFKYNLPDITQFDFFKGFLQLYGLIMKVDNYEKKVYVYGFDKVVGSKPIAIDWSDKLVKRTGTINNVIGNYGKNSIIKYIDTERSQNDEGRITITEAIAEEIYDKGVIIFWYADVTAWNNKDYEFGNTITETSFPSGQYRYETLPNVIEPSDLTTKDEGILRVENDDIPTERVILTFPFEACEIYYSVDQAGKKYTYVKFRDCEEKVLAKYDTPRLVTIDGDYAFNLVSEEGNTSAYYCVASNINADKSIQAQSMVSKYYSALETHVLSDVRYLTDVEIALNERDISIYDPYTPIYLEKYGAYFHVNKINNYMRGKITKVDLIKI